MAQFDFSLMKNTSLSEEVDLQFRAEFFNIFNRANFGQPTQIREGVEVFASVDSSLKDVDYRVLLTIF